MTNTQIKVKLEKASYPKMVTDLATQNHFLKILTYSLTGIATLLIILVVFLGQSSQRVVQKACGLIQ